MSSHSASSPIPQSAQIQEAVPALDSDLALEDAGDLVPISSDHGIPIPSSDPLKISSPGIQHYNELSSDPSPSGALAEDVEDEDEQMQDLYDKDDEPNGRPNKYRGPPSTYRHWVRAERQLHDSLTRLRAQDLSAHLYNAHALKRRARGLESKGESQSTKGKAKRKAGKSAFVPPDFWTAWPMPPDEVPREGEKVVGVEDEEWTFKMEEDSRASAVLEECLTAEVIRTAKERFESREWESGLLEVDGEEGSKASKEERPDGVDAVKKELFSTAERILGPVADEEKANRLAQPAVRRILHQLDCLLQNLHHQRAAYALNSSTSNGNDETEGSKKRSKPPRIQKPEGKGKASSTGGRKPAQSTTGTSNNNTDPEPRPKTTQRAPSTYAFGSTSTSASSHHDKQYPRDWSSALGLAALSSFSPSVLYRTAQRCSTLFGEDMLFRNLPENTPNSPPSTFLASNPLPPPSTSISKKDKRISRSRAPIPRDAEPHHYEYVSPTSDELFCPVMPCKPYNNEFGRTPFLNMKKRAEHMRIVHPWYKTPEAMDAEQLYGGVHINGFMEEVRPRREERRGRKKVEVKIEEEVED